MDFHDIIKRDVSDPLHDLCELLFEEGSYAEHQFFTGVMTMLADPSDEEMVLAAVIELSKCAFLGFSYSFEATERINEILDRSILIAHTMSASDA